MKARLEIIADEIWILDHMDDEPLPIDAIVVALDAKFDIETEEKGFANATVSVDKKYVEKVKDYVLSFVKKKYGEGQPSEIISFSCFDKMQEPAELDFDEWFSQMEALDEADGDELTEKQKIGMESYNKIQGLFGCKELKLLADDMLSLAKNGLEGKNLEPFENQAYIFSVNDGYGYTTAMKLFNSLLCELGLKRGSNTVAEVTIPQQKEDDRSPTAPFATAISALQRGKGGLLSIDISEWLHKTNTAPFRAFLRVVEENLNKNTVVFRIPFIDKDIVDNVKRSLNDMICVIDVSMPPYNKDEIQGYAERKIKEYGYTMEDEAWDIFHDRLTEEKADGRFYGLKTVKKVARELAYKKQLADAKSNIKTDTITVLDALLICPEAKERELSVDEMLSRLVAGEKLKERITEVVLQIQHARMNKGVNSPCVHMRFVGNPGTGKTTVARILGKILKEKGLLRIGNFYEYAGRDLCGRYVGETAPKTASICRDAYGSVLFIDEAYSLYRGEGNDTDYGREAIDTLIAEMENHRDDMLVIMAGYTDEMQTLMKSNAGLASRMPYVIEFPNFSRDELYRIFVSMIPKSMKYDEAVLDAAKEYFDNIPDSVIGAKEFSNARFVRNLFERTWAKAAMRCQLEGSSEITITRGDFERATADKEFTYMMQKKKARIGF